MVSVTSESMYTEVLSQACQGKKVVWLTDHLNMNIAVDREKKKHKPNKQTDEPKYRKMKNACIMNNGWRHG